LSDQLVVALTLFTAVQMVCACVAGRREQTATKAARRNRDFGVVFILRLQRGGLLGRPPGLDVWFMTGRKVFGKTGQEASFPERKPRSPGTATGTDKTMMTRPTCYYFNMTIAQRQRREMASH
jgi:hypothetical protein